MQQGDDWEKRAVLSGPFTRAGEPADEQQIDMFSTDNDIYTVAAGDMTGDESMRREGMHRRCCARRRSPALPAHCRPYRV